MHKPIKFIYALLIITIIGGGVVIMIQEQISKRLVAEKKEIPDLNIAKADFIKLDRDFCDVLINKAIAEILNDDSQSIITHTSSGSCEVSIAQGVSYILSFENVSKEKEPQFVLNIYTTDKILVQKVPIEYSWQFDLTTINLHDDINADGYKDILVRVFGPRAAEFSYLIYNPVNKIFEEDDMLSHIFTPTFNKEKMEISSTPDIPNYYYDDNGQQHYYSAEDQTTIYKFKNGKYSSQ